MRGPRVAIVEDSPEILALLGDVLRLDGQYRIEQLPPDTTTVDDVAAAGADLVICDLRLGGHDEGWQLIAALRREPSLAAIPIILCSADLVQLRERKDELDEMAAVWILEKPFSLDELEAALHAALPDAGRGAAARTVG